MSDPFRASMAVLAAVAITGLVAIAIGWRGVAASLVVALQLPYATSGVIGGVAVVGFALGLISVQAARRREAAERAEFARLVTAAADLLAGVRSDAGSRQR